MQTTCAALRECVAGLAADDTTLGALLDAARTVQSQLPARDAQDGDDVRLQFRSYARGARHTEVELIWHWPRPEQLDAPPGRLWLRFDVAGAGREVEVRAHDYPHVSAFVTAALEAAALDEHARASDVHLDLEREHMS